MEVFILFSWFVLLLSELTKAKLLSDNNTLPLKMTPVTFKSLLIPLSAVPLRFRCHKEGQVEVSLQSPPSALHCSVCVCVRLNRVPLHQ